MSRYPMGDTPLWVKAVITATLDSETGFFSPVNMSTSVNPPTLPKNIKSIKINLLATCRLAVRFCESPTVPTAETTSNATLSRDIPPLMPAPSIAHITIVLITVTNR